MTIAITDANIFFDLMELELLPFLFDIQLDIQTTTLVLLECDPDQRKVLRQLVKDGKLKIKDVAEQDEAQFHQIKGSKGLAMADRSVILIASQTPDCIILTGDNAVRKWCKQNKVRIHGILWLLEAFIFHGHLSFITGLEQLAALQQINQWLPVKICEDCERAWKGERLTLEGSLPKQKDNDE